MRPSGAKLEGFGQVSHFFFIRQWRSHLSALATLLTVLVGVALPSAVSAAPDWTSVQQITQFIVDDSYTTVMIPAIDNPMGCSAPSVLRVGKLDSNYQSLTAAILSAHAQGKKVRLFAAACLTDGAGAEHVKSNITIHL